MRRIAFILLVVTGTATAGDRDERLFQLSVDAFSKRIAAAPEATPIPVPPEFADKPSLVASAAAVFGLVLLGEKTSLHAGKHKQVLGKLHAYITHKEVLAPTAIRSHETWVLSFVMLYLAELDRIEPAQAHKDLLAALATRLGQGRNGARGWHHSLKSNGYGPFSAATLWATAALRAARQRGIAVNKEVLANADKALKECLRPSGGASYFCYANKTVLSPARAGGVIWALATSGKAGKKEILRTQQFILNHVDHVPAGHGSWAMNLAQAALGISVMSDAAQKTFWTTHRQTILFARKPDGSFPPKNWNEIGFSDARTPTLVQLGKKNTWPDQKFGDAFTTPWMLLAWQCRRGRCVLVNR